MYGSKVNAEVFRTAMVDSTSEDASFVPRVRVAEVRGKRGRLLRSTGRGGPRPTKRIIHPLTVLSRRLVTTEVG